MTFNLNGFVTITDTPEIFNANFCRAMCQDFNYKIRLRLGDFKQKIQEKVLAILSSCALYRDIESGKLDGDFGFLKSEGKNNIDLIIQTIVDDIEVNFTNFSFSNNSINGGIDVYILEDTYKKILALPVSSRLTNSFSQLDWLRWVLLEGNKIIIAGFHISYGQYPTSRSGDALMFKNGNWKIQPQYAGTQNDNFLTRAMDDNMSNLESSVGVYFEALLR